MAGAEALGGGEVVLLARVKQDCIAFAVKVVKRRKGEGQPYWSVRRMGHFIFLVKTHWAAFSLALNNRSGTR